MISQDCIPQKGFQGQYKNMILETLRYNQRRISKNNKNIQFLLEPINQNVVINDTTIYTMLPSRIKSNDDIESRYNINTKELNDIRKYIQMYPQHSLYNIIEVQVYTDVDNIKIIFNCCEIYGTHGNILQQIENLLPIIQHIRISIYRYPILKPSIQQNYMDDIISSTTDPTVNDNNIIEENKSSLCILDENTKYIKYEEFIHDSIINYSTILYYISITNYKGHISLNLPQKIKGLKKLLTYGDLPISTVIQSAGILYVCTGKKDIPYILLGQDRKRKKWGPFYGRPDRNDKDIEWTAVRESEEESLGIFIDTNLLYYMLKNDKCHLRINNSGLFIINMGILDSDNRNRFIIQFQKELSLRKHDNTLTKPQNEILKIDWFNVHTIISNLNKGKFHKALILRSHFQKNLKLLLQDLQFIKFINTGYLSILSVPETISMINYTTNSIP